MTGAILPRLGATAFGTVRAKVKYRRKRRAKLRRHPTIWPTQNRVNPTVNQRINGHKNMYLIY